MSTGRLFAMMSVVIDLSEIVYLACKSTVRGWLGM